MFRCIHSLCCLVFKFFTLYYMLYDLIHHLAYILIKQQKQYTAIFQLWRIFLKLILLLNSNRYVMCCRTFHNKWFIKVWNQKPNNLQTWQGICRLIMSFNWGRCLVNNGQTHDVHLIIWYLFNDYYDFFPKQICNKRTCCFALVLYTDWMVTQFTQSS